MSASDFVKGYCGRSGITEREFYETQVPMPDPTSAYGWSAVSNSPLLIKAHIDLYLSQQPEVSADNSKVIGTYTGADGQDYPIIALGLMKSEKKAQIFIGDEGPVTFLGAHIEPYQIVTSAPAPVAPDEVTAEDCPAFVKYEVTEVDEAWVRGFNACRAAMLQAGNHPAQSDCCPAQNVVAPAQSPIDHGYRPECECSGCKATARICTEMAVNSLVIPNEMTSEQAYEIGYYYGDPVDVFARGANWMRQHIIDSTLAAAPQLPGSDPATVPGKWIPVSERMPEDDDFVYIWPRPDFGVELHVGQYCECSPKGDGWYAQVYEQNYGIEWHPITVTHWMPLPAAPQEVKSES